EAAEDGGLGGLGAPIDAWKAGEWHQITATWNGSEMTLYLDGQFVSRTVHDAPVEIPPDAKLFLGSDFPEGRPVAPGTIGQVYVRGAQRDARGAEAPAPARAIDLTSWNHPRCRFSAFPPPDRLRVGETRAMQLRRREPCPG